MLPRWRKLIADLIGNPIRTILVVASISVGLFAVGMLVTIHFIVQDDMARGYAKFNPPNILITVDQITEDTVNNIKNIKGVAQVEGARKFNIRMLDRDGNWVSADMLARKTFSAPDLMNVNLIDGRLEINEREILIDQFKFEQVQVFEDNLIQVELPSGSVKSLQLAGKIQDQTIGIDTGGGGFFTSPIQGYISLDSLSFLEQGQSFNQIYLTTTSENGELDQIRAISDEIVDYLGKNGVRIAQTTVKKSDTHPNFIYVNAIANLLFVLVFMIVFLSSFLIITTLSAIMSQQIQQIGIMKSIGGTKKQIYTIYTILIFFFGLIAFGLALPLSMLSGFKMVSFLANTANFVFLGERYLWQPFLISDNYCDGYPSGCWSIPYSSWDKNKSH